MFDPLIVYGDMAVGTILGEIRQTADVFIVSFQLPIPIGNGKIVTVYGCNELTRVEIKDAPATVPVALDRTRDNPVVSPLIVPQPWKDECPKCGALANQKCRSVVDGAVLFDMHRERTSDADPA